MKEKLSDTFDCPNTKRFGQMFAEKNCSKLR